MKQPLPLTANQQDIFDLTESTQGNLLITGPPGCGKSVLNNALLELGKKRYVMSAPTGLAAINVQGRTLHSLFRIPVSEGVIVPEYNVFNQDIRTTSMLRGLKVLIIDEISMVRVDVFEFMDRMLRTIRKIDHPFGGVQIVAVGDFYQLPPVVRREDQVELHARWSSPYVFSSQVFESFRSVRLTEVLRQKGDSEFIGLLHSARAGRLTDVQVGRLNGQVSPVQDVRIRLVAVNKQADAINQAFLAGLPSQKTIYEAEVFGDWPADPVDRQISLKVGAQVMVKLNNADAGEGQIGGKVVNGTIGRVVALEKKRIRLELEDKDQVWIYRKRFERRIKEFTAGDWSERLVASFEQLPVMLAWAISMHKSQGQSFDKAHIDASRVFSQGQAYVALSRIRSLAGLSLEAPLSVEHFWPDKKVLEWDKHLV